MPPATESQMLRGVPSRKRNLSENRCTATKPARASREIKAALIARHPSPKASQQAGERRGRSAPAFSAEEQYSLSHASDVPLLSLLEPPLLPLVYRLLVKEVQRLG